ncbi:hypothetical protein [Kordiimonas lacus]|uniref:ABC-type amino acid transport substrate-binding protein n=1 Tax=Kordiimonas lacus TaxID=637679 RepID=A0A1G7B8H0_9PROT|nr:hypothetical protein [Kordiimonas lacus]SDE23313.1 hypothetical protein SAMN04488071_2410 [Kordiimonas lacus]
MRKKTLRPVRSAILGLVCCLLMGLASSNMAGAQPDRDGLVVVRPLIVPGDSRFSYYEDLLRAAMDATVPSYGAYGWEPWADDEFTKRLAEMLERATYVNVVYSAWDPVLGKVAEPVVPHIRKGVNGYRLLLIRKADRERFAGLQTREDLAKFMAGQGRGWPDVEIYRASDMPVLAIGKFSQLLPMLQSGRFDYYPLGVTEAPKFLRECGVACDDLMIEPTLLIRYPFPIHFHVSKAEPRLHARLTAGVGLLLKSGEFDVIWNRHHKPELEGVTLAGRKVIALENPNLPPDTLLGRSELWIDLETN